jgi:hypothetical protein
MVSLHGCSWLSKRGLSIVATAFLIASAGIHGARADVVTDWNAIAAGLPIPAPPVMARVLAAMHGAMHDAVNSIDPRYEHYRFPVPAPAGASKDAAAAAAAHAVLVGLVPAQKGAFDTALAASLAKIPDGQPKTDGIAVGKAAGTDATIAVFKIKYAHNYWRPVTAIRYAASPGNPAVAADPTWEPLLITPPHPEFPSGHCIVTGAAAQVLREFLGSDQVNFSYVAPHGLGTMRSYTSFSQIEKEMEDARVWAGIHRSTDEESTELGRKIGAHAIANYLRPR